MSGIAIISGEVSGDMAGGALANALHALRPEIPLWGIGGANMAKAGVEILYDSALWSAIGVVETLKVYPKIRYTVYPRILGEIYRRKPELIILIDFGAFNVRVAKWCKPKGFHILYYFPPGSWRRTGSKGAELAGIADKIATPFPWSAERLKRLGADVEYVGHPLVEIVRASLSRDQLCKKFGLALDRPIIGLLPGSRPFEVQYNTPVMLEAAEIITQSIMSPQFVFAAASDMAAKRIEKLVDAHVNRNSAPAKRNQRENTQRERIITTPEGFTLRGKNFKEMANIGKAPIHKCNGSPSFVITRDQTWNVMAHSDALMICSGTATLEAAILRTPMVIIYRGSRLMEFERRMRRINPEHIGMPNIIAQKRVVPEYIQNEATPETIASHIISYLKEPDTRQAIRNELSQIKEMLGEVGASERTARIALELMNG